MGVEAHDESDSDVQQQPKNYIIKWADSTSLDPSRQRKRLLLQRRDVFEEINVSTADEPAADRDRDLLHRV